MLNFPVLNVYRKTRNTVGENGPASTFASANSRTNNRRTYSAQQNTGKKRVQRSRVNRVFSGVAGGIAEYAGVSPALVRFGFVATMFMFFPLSVFAYLFLSIILPVNYEGWDSNNRNNNNSNPRNPGQQG
ncbi:MAG: PspC domain-containing protein [Bacteroidetes bacterium]|nr:MAG: PspC domain-containing protein [Bacteroidota bacterium]